MMVIIEKVRQLAVAPEQPSHSASLLLLPTLKYLILTRVKMWFGAVWLCWAGVSVRDVILFKLKDILGLISMTAGGRKPAVDW